VGEASYAAVPHLVRICRKRGIMDWNTILADPGCYRREKKWELLPRREAAFIFAR